MPNRFGVPLMVLVPALAFSPVALGRSKRPQQAPAVKDQKSAAVKGQKTAPSAAPRHDLSGTWEPANGPSDGIQPDGVKAMPNDGKPEHQLPYTPCLTRLTDCKHTSPITHCLDPTRISPSLIMIRATNASRWDSRA